MRILHIGIDSHFVDFMVDRFERAAPGANELVTVSYVEPGERERAFTGPTSWAGLTATDVVRVREQAAAADVVVAHAMTDFTALVCADLPARTVLVWSGFGYDYYVGAAAEDTIAPATRKLLTRVSRGKVLDPAGRLVAPRELERLEPVAFDVTRQLVARRADYFSAPVEADLGVFTRAFPGFAGEYRQLNYADLASMSRAGAPDVRGEDILLGNSSSWSNNHLEALRMLAECDLGERRVVVPLTYGDQAYREAVLRAGERLLANNFHPLVDHLPLEDYLELVAGCRVTLFNHRRQQGLGNIVAALQQGSWVYLNRRNPLFGWFTERGVEVRPAAALREGIPTDDVPADVLARHRAFLEEMWGAERVDANLSSFVAELGSRVSASGRRARLPRGLRARRQR